MLGAPDYWYSILEKCFAVFERIWYPFERLGVSVPKKLSSIRTAWAMCLEKIVLCLNSLGYLFPPKINVICLNGLGCPFGKNCHLFERLGLSVSKNCSVRTLGLSVWKRNCQLLEELNLSVQRSILAKFLSQNHFIVATRVKRSVILQVSYTVRYEVCLQTYREWLWISAPL